MALVADLHAELVHTETTSSLTVEIDVVVAFFTASHWAIGT
jgi:hypothetical protein